MVMLVTRRCRRRHLPIDTSRSQDCSGFPLTFGASSRRAGDARRSCSACWWRSWAPSESSSWHPMRVGPSVRGPLGRMQPFGPRHSRAGSDSIARRARGGVGAHRASVCAAPRSSRLDERSSLQSRRPSSPTLAPAPAPASCAAGPTGPRPASPTQRGSTSAHRPRISGWVSPASSASPSRRSSRATTAPGGRWSASPTEPG